MVLDADLVAYYDAEARGQYRVVHGEFRSDLLRNFAALLESGISSRTVDVGAGPGLDVVALQEAGFRLSASTLPLETSLAWFVVVGPSWDPSTTCRSQRGRSTRLWTMSTFVHVPDERFDDAIVEMLRVVRPGSPLGIGTWGGLDFEGIHEFGDLRPYRFFSLATHERWHSMLSRHGEVELFEIHDPEDEHGWQYQFAVLRAPG